MATPTMYKPRIKPFAGMTQPTIPGLTPPEAPRQNYMSDSAGGYAYAKPQPIAKPTPQGVDPLPPVPVPQDIARPITKPTPIDDPVMQPPSDTRPPVVDPGVGADMAKPLIKPPYTPPGETGTKPMTRPVRQRRHRFGRLPDRPVSIVDTQLPE